MRLFKKSGDTAKFMNLYSILTRRFSTMSYTPPHGIRATGIRATLNSIGAPPDLIFRREYGPAEYGPLKFKPFVAEFRAEHGPLSKNVLK